MKFAIVDGQRREACPGLTGNCPTCDAPVLARCGSIRVWHWSHVGRRTCDAWWEHETPWHRAWKACFPLDWQEVVFKAASGERHVADVATPTGWTLEFQHSHLAAAERMARDAFYPRLLWVVDGQRRQQDREQFFAAVCAGQRHAEHPLWWIERHGALLRDWCGGRTAVFFDFGQESEFDAQYLWYLVPGSELGMAHVARIARSIVIDCLRDERPAGPRQQGALLDKVGKLAAQMAATPIAHPRLVMPMWPTSRGHGRPLHGFERHLARQARKRKRF